MYHASIDNGEEILTNGLDPASAPTFVTRDLEAAQDVLLNHPDAVAGQEGTIIQSEIPASQFQQSLAPLERLYTGFYPYPLQSTEITLRTAEQVQVFDQGIVGPVPLPRLR